MDLIIESLTWSRPCSSFHLRHLVPQRENMYPFSTNLDALTILFGVSDKGKICSGTRYVPRFTGLGILSAKKAIKYRLTLAILTQSHMA